MESHFVKHGFRFSFEKIIVSLEKWKLLKVEFMRDTSEFDWSKNENLFDWHWKYVYIEWFVLKFLYIVYCLYGQVDEKNSVLCCCYFSTAVITEDFYCSQLKIQVTVCLIFT